MKIIRWLTLLAILLGFGLRVLLLQNKQALEYDDAISLLVATGHEGEYAQISAQGQPPVGVWTAASEWKRLIEVEAGHGLPLVAADLARYDLHPPLYFWILHGWIVLFGAGVHSLNALNLVIDLLTLLVMLAAGRWVFGDVTYGALAGAVWFLSPIAMKASFWVRQYALLVFFSILFVYLLYRAFAQPPGWHRSNLVRFAVILAGLAGLLTHYYFVLLLGVGGLLLASVYLTGRRERVWLLQAMVFLAAIALLFLALYPGFRSTLATYAESRLAARLTGFDLADRLKNVAKTLLLLFSPALLGLGLRYAIQWSSSWSRAAAPIDPPEPDPAPHVEDQPRFFQWMLAFALIPTLIILVLYLAAFTQAHTFSSRYLSFISPFVAFLPVFLLRRKPTRVGWMVAFLAGVVALGSLTLNPTLAESQLGTIDVQSLQAAPVVVVDSIAWGTWPAAMQYINASQPVFVASQDALAANPDAWLDRLGAGGIYVSFIRGEENTVEKRRVILDLIKQRYPISLVSVLYRPDSWALVLFRVGEAANPIAGPSGAEAGSPLSLWSRR